MKAILPPNIGNKDNLICSYEDGTKEDIAFLIERYDKGGNLRFFVNAEAPDIPIASYSEGSSGGIVSIAFPSNAKDTSGRLLSITFITTLDELKGEISFNFFKNEFPELQRDLESLRLFLSKEGFNIHNAIQKSIQRGYRSFELINYDRPLKKKKKIIIIATSVIALLVIGLIALLPDSNETSKDSQTKQSIK